MDHLLPIPTRVIRIGRVHREWLMLRGEAKFLTANVRTVLDTFVGGGEYEVWVDVGSLEDGGGS